MYLLLSPPLVYIFFYRLSLATLMGTPQLPIYSSSLFNYGTPASDQHHGIGTQAYVLSSLDAEVLLYSITTFSNVRLIVHNLTKRIGVLFVTQNTMSTDLHLTNIVWRLYVIRKLTLIYFLLMCCRFENLVKHCHDNTFWMLKQSLSPETKFMFVTCFTNFSKHTAPRETFYNFYFQTV